MLDENQIAEAFDFLDDYETRMGNHKASYHQLKNNFITQKTHNIDVIERLKVLAKEIFEAKENTSPSLPIFEKPRHLLPPPFQPEVFIGRAENLAEIHQTLFSRAKEDTILLLVNGQGGIGKTSLAAKYYQQYGKYYSHLAWTLAEPSILDALLKLALPLDVEFSPEMEKEQQLDLLLTQMANLEKPCLLILDNANDPADLEKYYKALRSCHNFHLLLTSRITNFESAQTYLIDSLSKENALTLFKKHFPQHKSEEDVLFENIYDAIDGNTLVIEVLAKNLNNLNNALKTRYSLVDLLSDIEEKGLLFIQKHSQKEIDVDWHH